MTRKMGRRQRMSNGEKGWWEDYKPPLPTSGSVVFGSREDWQLNACLNFVDTESQWDLYADGYRRAGDILVDHAAATNSDQDILVFPIVFNYRQYLELRLKELLVLSRQLGDDREPIEPDHPLLPLWGRVRENIEKYWPTDDNFDAVEEIIKQFNDVDPRSFAFRYPVKKDFGTPSLPDQQHINLGQVRARISEIATVLDGVSALLSEYLDSKREQEADIRAEYANEMRDYSGP
jgi:hypothetical protein